MKIKVTFCFYQHPHAIHHLDEWEQSMEDRVNYMQKFANNERVYFLDGSNLYEYEVLFVMPLGGTRFIEHKGNILLAIKCEIIKLVTRIFKLTDDKEVHILKAYKVLIFGKVETKEVGFIHRIMETADGS